MVRRSAFLAVGGFEHTISAGAEGFANQLADRAVEIVVDRGFEGRVSAAEWEAVCRLMEEHFRARRFEAGSIAGVEAIGNLLNRHFPSSSKRPTKSHNELPDRPTLL